MPALLTFSADASEVGGREQSFGQQDGALPTRETHTFCHTDDMFIWSPVTLKQSSTKLVDARNQHWDPQVMKQDNSVCKAF